MPQQTNVFILTVTGNPIVSDDLTNDHPSFCNATLLWTEDYGEFCNRSKQFITIIV